MSTRLRSARPESASLPILVVGEPTDPQTKDRLANVGITAFLPLPVNPDDAAGVIRGVYMDRIENGGPQAVQLVTHDPTL